jgi:hypothetical protein
MHSSAKTYGARYVDITNVRITHKTARVPLLEAVSFKNKTNVNSDLRRLDGVQEPRAQFEIKQ